MQILVVSSTVAEIEGLIKARPDLSYCITGAGAPATVFAVAEALSNKHYDFVLQAGVAGSFNYGDAAEAEVVAVARDRFADLGVYAEDNFTSIFEMGLADENKDPFKAGWLLNDLSQFTFLPPSMKRVDAITVNAIQSAEKINMVMRQKYGATIESMEGAAMHYVCLRKGIPFLQLRAVSNLVGDRNKDNWNLLQAFENLSNSIVQILNKISDEN